MVTHRSPGSNRLILVDIAWSQSVLSAAVQNWRTCVQTPSKAMTSKLFYLMKKKTGIWNIKFTDNSTTLEYQTKPHKSHSFYSMQIFVFYRKHLDLKWLLLFLIKLIDDKNNNNDTFTILNKSIIINIWLKWLYT